MTDITLKTYVDVANGQTERVDPSDISKNQPVTLFVHGQVITGTIIPAWQLLEDLGKGDNWDLQAPGPFSGLAREVRSIEERRNALPETDMSTWTSDDRQFYEDTEATVVNLANAKWQGPQGPLLPSQGDGVLLRVRLDAVDAFTPGRLGSAPA